MTSAEPPARSIRAMPIQLTPSQVATALRRFRLQSSGGTEVRLSPDASRAIVSSIDVESLALDWEVLCRLATEIVSAERAAGPSDEPRRIHARPDSTHRPLALLDSPLLDRKPDGSVILLGDAARLLAALDRSLTRLARAFQATPIECPPVWSEDELPRFGYTSNSENLLRVERPGQEGSYFWQLAACYNVWQHLSGRHLDEPVLHTVRGTCCRAEGGHYFLLERMRCFTMREITFAGSDERVRGIEQRAISSLEEMTMELGLGGSITVADDPFFLIDRREGAPELASSKLELRLDIYDDKSLACASVNVHGDFFARRMGISGVDGHPVSTGCVAFGLERWVWAILTQHGADPRRWPPGVQRLLEDDR